MDGKTGAEELIAKVLQDPTILKTLAASPKTPAGSAAEGGVADKSAS
jgi:type VI secretion system protein ImpB